MEPRLKSISTNCRLKHYVGCH